VPSGTTRRALLDVPDRQPAAAPPDPLPAVAVFVVCAAALAITAPAALVAVAVGEFLRRRALRWTWTVAPTLLTAAPLALEGPQLLTDTAVHLARAVRSDATLAAALPTALPLWVFLTPLATTVLMLWRDRQDRLDGGARERGTRRAPRVRFSSARTATAPSSWSPFL
jgi:hypothetical protein